jgi:hypothetical protein
MEHVSSSMLETHPRKPELKGDTLVTCIDACNECGESCTACADACLGEQMVADLVRCIRLNEDCADVCATTARLVSRQTEPDSALVRAQLSACLVACEKCASECDRHAAMHEHCRICAESCRVCASACRDLIEKLKAS